MTHNYVLFELIFCFNFIITQYTYYILT